MSLLLRRLYLQRCVLYRTSDTRIYLFLRFNIFRAFCSIGASFTFVITFVSQCVVGTVHIYKYGLENVHLFLKYKFSLKPYVPW